MSSDVGSVADPERLYSTVSSNILCIYCYYILILLHALIEIVVHAEIVRERFVVSFQQSICLLCTIDAIDCDGSC